MSGELCELDKTKKKKHRCETATISTVPLRSNSLFAKKIWEIWSEVYTEVVWNVLLLWHENLQISLILIQIYVQNSEGNYLPFDNSFTSASHLTEECVEHAPDALHGGVIQSCFIIHQLEKILWRPAQ